MKRSVPESTIRLPWQGNDVPHAILDIGRGCNIACPGCYNNSSRQLKSIEQLESDLKALRGHRRLHTISITGGEPLLHLEITTIVGMIAKAGIKPAILTNGTRLAHDLLDELKKAGLAAILLHIQSGQRRPDIAKDADQAAFSQLRAEKARLVHQHGIKVGLTWTAYRSHLDELEMALDEVLSSDHMDYFLAIGYRDFSRFKKIVGEVGHAFRGEPPDSGNVCAEEVCIDDMVPLFRSRGISPFGYVPSSHDSNKARWYTHLVAITQDKGGKRRQLSMRPAISDRIFTKLIHAVTHRHVFLYTPGILQLVIQLACNALSGGKFLENATVLLRVLRGDRLFDKHLLLQEGPTLHKNGDIEYCDSCPDAVWKNGKFVPVCISDRLASP